MEMQETSVNTAPEVVESAEAVNAAQQIEQGEVESTPKTELQEQVTEQSSETRIDKAFAARLRKEQEKIEAKYSKHNFIIEKAAAESGMSVDEYIAAVEKTYKEKEFENLDPSIREDVMWARERRTQEAKEKEQRAKDEAWNGEIKSLIERFPDLKSASDIPDEVLAARLEHNVPLRYAYADYMLGKERTKIEQETLKKLQENTNSSVGSLSSTGVNTKVKISEMNDDDFDRLMEEVKRGTRKTL